MNKRKEYYEELLTKPFNPFSLIHEEQDCSKVAGIMLSSKMDEMDHGTAVAAGYYLSLIFTYIYSHSTENNHNMETVAILLNASYLEEGNPNSITENIFLEVIEAVPDCLLAKLYAQYEQCEKDKNSVVDWCYEILLWFEPESIGNCGTDAGQMEEQDMYDEDYDEDDYDEPYEMRFSSMFNIYYEQRECLALVNDQLSARLAGKKLSKLSLTELLLLKNALHLDSIERKQDQLLEEIEKLDGDLKYGLEFGR